MDSKGNVYVIGTTFSPDYPTTPGAFDESFNGVRDAFIFKIIDDFKIESIPIDEHIDLEYPIISEDILDLMPCQLRPSYVPCPRIPPMCLECEEILSTIKSPKEFAELPRDTILNLTPKMFEGLHPQIQKSLSPKILEFSHNKMIQVIFVGQTDVDKRVEKMLMNTPPPKIFLAPLTQYANGIYPDDVVCNNEYEMIKKINDEIPRCVKSSSVQILTDRGWIEKTTVFQEN